MADEGKQSAIEVEYEDPPDPPEHKTSTSVRLTITASSIAAIIADIPAVYAAIKGEPVAEATARTLAPSLNNQADHIQQLRDRVARLEGTQDSASRQEFLLLKEELRDLRRALSDSKVRGVVYRKAKPRSSSDSIDKALMEEVKVRKRLEAEKLMLQRKLEDEKLRDAPRPLKRVPESAKQMQQSEAF